MLSHENILFCSHALTESLNLLPDKQEILVSYLPLNHIIAQYFDIFLAVENGFLVYFADRNALKCTIIQTIQKAKCSMLVGVPRVYEKILEKFKQYELQSYRVSQFLISMACSFMESYHLDKMLGKETSEWKYWLSSLVVQRIKMFMGLQCVTRSFVGGAPLTIVTKKFFFSLDLTLIEGFGLSETSGALTYNFDRPNFQTVGKAVKGVELRIDNPDEKGQGGVSCIF